MTQESLPSESDNPCQACGACCAYSQNWPRFSIEEDAALDLIPAKFVNERQSGMRCEGDRCSALSGQIGIETTCVVYAVRPAAPACQATPNATWRGGNGGCRS
jgi:uncharacterized protein